MTKKTMTRIVFVKSAIEIWIGEQWLPNDAQCAEGTNYAIFTEKIKFNKINRDD